MTTDIKIASATNIFLDNDVFNLEGAKEGEVLSVAKFATNGLESESVASVLNFLYELIGLRFSEHKLWIFLGSPAWQQDARIIRYRKLWGALKFRGLEIVDGSDSQEHVVEAEGKVKFFGALRFSKSSIGTVARVLEIERCSYIVALPKDFGVSAILNRGWTGELNRDQDFYHLVSKGEGLLFKKLGEFDDGERALLFIGSPSLMDRLLN
ncbi:hypothetical protein [Pseudomonas sp. St316]|uniref:hypothetical protein n=1 Tax=Pseudomonas sp. St316 TaxID=2678257 RepID=UPI001BB411D7|nr:hypothetical protein [Pseudomonas sp. St316]BBP61604.1 hypothetical protein PHLH4_51940 [Pseudomonas sp. St316]